MRAATYAAILLLGFALPTAFAQPQPGELFPTSRPRPLPADLFGADAVRSPRTTAFLTAPLIDEKQKAEFSEGYGGLINDAKTKDDRLAVVELLLRKAKGMQDRPAMQRFMLLQALDLAQKAEAPAETLAPVAASLLPLLHQGETLAVAEAYAQTLKYFRNHPAGTDITAREVADAYYWLAQLQLSVDKPGEAAKNADEALVWAAKDTDGSAVAKATITRLADEAKSLLALQQGYAQNPADPVINSRLAWRALQQERDLIEMIPYASRSNLPSLNHLADALKSNLDGTPKTLKVAAALTECLADTTDTDQRAVAATLWKTATRVTADKTATEAQRNQADLYLIKAERIVGKGSPPAAALTGADTGQKKVTFYTLNDAAERIVFILDRSGSMVDNFSFVQDEVRRSVNALSPEQSFAIITFSEDVTVLTTGPDPSPPKAFFPPHPQPVRTPAAPPATRSQPSAVEAVKATPENKEALIAKMDKQVPRGENDDLLEPFLDAFKTAFRLKPDLVIFLTDGRFDERLVGEINDKLNKDHKVRINTIAFVNARKDYMEQLQNLAKVNGGKFKFISEKDLAGGH